MTRSTMAALDKDTEKLVVHQLKSGEEVVWAGTCIDRKGRACSVRGPAGSAATGAFFGLILSLFLGAWFGLDFQFSAPVAVPILAYLVSRGSVKAFHRKGGAYVLTDRRLFVCSKLYSTTKVRSLPLECLESVSVVKKPYNRITLHFANVNKERSSAGKPFLSFRLIRDSDPVVNLLSRDRPSLRVRFGSDQPAI